MSKKLCSVFAVAIFSISLVSVSFAETLSPALCKQKAQAAAELLNSEGDAALAKIKDANGEFRFADGKPLPTLAVEAEPRNEEPV